MSTGYELLVFDWDGTLADTLDCIVEPMAAAFAEAGLPVPSAERIAATIGVPLTDIVASLSPPDARGPAQVEGVVQRYRSLQQGFLGRLRLFPGFSELSAGLRARGCRAAILSNKGRADLLGNLRQLGLEEHFARVSAGDDYPPEERKPHPRPLLDLIGALGVEPRRTLMIGDTVYDLRMAQRAGVDSAAVVWGCHPLERLKQEAPRHVLRRLEDLLPLLARG